MPAHAGLAVVRSRPDPHGPSGALVQSFEIAVLRLHVDDPRVFSIHPGLETVAAARSNPVAGADAHAVHSAGRPLHRTVVLRAAVNVVEGRGIVERDPVKLRGRQIREVTPRVTTVEGLVETAVVSHQEIVGVTRIKGHSVVVNVHVPAKPTESLAAVFSNVHPHVHRIDMIEVVRVRVNLAVVLRVDHLVVAPPRPRFTAVR